MNGLDGGVTGDDLVRKGSKKRAFLSAGGDRAQKTMRTGILSNTRRLDDISVPRRRGGVGEAVGVAHTVRAQDLKNGVALLLVWEYSGAMAVVEVEVMYLNARTFRALPSQGWAPTTTHCRRCRITVYKARRMRHEMGGTVKEHAEKRSDRPVLRDIVEAEYVPTVAIFARDVKAGRLSNDKLRYSMLPWPYYTMPLLVWSRIWLDNTKLERRPRTELGCPFFVRGHNWEFNMVSPVEKSRFCVAAPPSLKGYKPSRTFIGPPSLVFAYRSSALADVPEAGTAGEERDAYMQAAIPDHVVMAIMQVLVRAWPCLKEHLDDTPD